jgi:hypothetical protein
MINLLAARLFGFAEPQSALCDFAVFSGKLPFMEQEIDCKLQSISS